jgi:hypothetical protein
MLMVTLLHQIIMLSLNKNMFKLIQRKFQELPLGGQSRGEW